MNRKKRVFLLVLDSVGIGEAIDAEDFGDVGANTLKSICSYSALSIPNLEKLGLFHIQHNDWKDTKGTPTASFARMQEKSRGKDTIIGHWELAGLVSPAPMPTFPQGFPKELLDVFSQKTGKEILCNLPYSGTKVLEDYGQEHLETGDLIVYTSADSVFQIAAHEDIVPVETLYHYCQIARDLLIGPWAVGRVIARPFTGEFPFVRTANRHDYALQPPEQTVLDRIVANGQTVIGVGKIHDIFNGQGVSASYPTKNNSHGMEVLHDLVQQDFHGLCFVNLVDFDMVYGHRRNIPGYAQALTDFDVKLGEFLPQLQQDDLLILTADHGCDPGFQATTDHTREDVPLLIYDPQMPQGIDMGVIYGFDHVKTILEKALLQEELWPILTCTAI